MPTLTLRNSVMIGSGCAPYFVAEVNSSHNGDMETAKKMIDASANAGCSCVKFQSWSAETLYSKSYYKKNPIAKRFVNKFSLNENQLLELAQYCISKGVAFSSTPYSEKEVDFLVETAKAPFVKIASMELNNYPFLEYIARKGVPIVLSTGMGDAEEIRRAVKTIENAGNTQICLLHCISIYPADPSTINLKNITWLQNEFPNYPIGFSDHSLGTEMAAAAVALGACFIEKHLTLDKTKIGMDNQMAAEPAEMSELVRQCRNVCNALGSMERKVSQEELSQRLNMRRSLVYTRDLKAGDILTESDITSKRPGTGYPPDSKESFIGKKLMHDAEEDTLLMKEDFE